MEFSTLVEIINEAGYEVRSYSGRGMFGRECVGFTVGREYTIFEVMANLFETATDYDHGVFELADAIKAAQMDSMGLDTIVYFPRVKWEGE